MLCAGLKNCVTWFRPVKEDLGGFGEVTGGIRQKRSEMSGLTLVLHVYETNRRGQLMGTETEVKWMALKVC
jgi:hypothetical protein